jgi:hypothetical protein
MSLSRSSRWWHGPQGATTYIAVQSSPLRQRQAPQNFLPSVFDCELAPSDFVSYVTSRHFFSIVVEAFLPCAIRKRICGGT